MNFKKWYWNRLEVVVLNACTFKPKRYPFNYLNATFQMNEHITCGRNGLCNDIPLLEYLLVKKSTNGVFSGGGGAAWNSCFLSLMKTMWACKSWKMKNPRWMDHAIKGGKLISFQLICQYFQIRKHSWTHPLILKNFCFTFINYFGIFWCLILPSHIPFFYFFI